eukprot:3269149-Alexandrium_andersonii.AAC.1
MSDLEGLPNTVDASRHDDAVCERFVHLHNALETPAAWQLQADRCGCPGVPAFHVQSAIEGKMALLGQGDAVVKP